MHDQNFDQDSISERIACNSITIFKISAKNASSRCSKVNSPQKQNQHNRDNIQTMIKDLYNTEKGKKKSLSKSNRGWQRGCDKKQVRLMQLRQQKDKKQLENCTFQPNGYKQIRTRRSLGEFLEDQSNFEKRRNAKKMMLKEDLEQQQRHQFRPSIQNNYPVDSTRRSEKPIYERLYQQRIKQKEEVQIGSKGRGNLKSKSKSKSRNNTFVNRLYDDAIRRQQQLRSDQNPKQETQRTVNLVNERYVAQKFIKQLYSIIEQMKLDPSHLLDYLTFNELLHKLGFVTNLQETDTKLASPERTLVYEAFTYLSQTQLSMKNVCVFLLALIGIYYIDPINFNAEQEQDDSLILNLNQAEGRKLQKHFDLLYRNRLIADDFKRTTTRIPNVMNCTFKPQINPESDLMAENYRNKVMKETATIMGHYELDLPSNASINHTDILILNKMGKQKIREEIRMQQEEKEMKECTFKPKTLENKSRPSSQKSSRCLELYNLHKKKIIRENPVEVQVNDLQCTFTPSIKAHNKGRKSISSNPKNSDKEILRMTECRKQKEQINKFLQRGYNKTNIAWKQKEKLKEVKERKSQRGSESSIPSEINSDQTPFLVVDVSLGNSADSIVIFKSQINKSKTLAEEFAKKHGLDSDTKGKLRDLLEQEIRNVLEKIEQESNGSES